MSVRFDPYLVWRYVLGDIPPSEDGDSGDKLFTVLVQRKVASKPLIDVTRLDPDAEEHDVKDLNNQFLPSHVHCVSVDAQGLRFQPGLVTARGLKLLLVVAPRYAHSPWNNIARAELALSRDAISLWPDTAPRRQANPGADGSRQPPLFSELVGMLTQQSPAFENARQASSPEQPLRPRCGVEVCVIDDRCNFASATLLAGSSSKIKQVLMLGGDKESLQAFDRTRRFVSPITPLPDLPGLPGIGGFQFSGCLQGRVLNTSQFEPGRGPVGLPAQTLADEPGTYRSVSYLNPAPHGSHGAAVLDLIANPWLRIGDRAWPRPAPKDLRFAQLPVSTVVDTSGASLSPHVLDAIHDALQKAKPDHDVIVNLSFGTHSGPHDGTSMIECAFVELLNLFNGSAAVNGKRLILVVPAGNSHLLRCHATDWAMPGSPSEFDWKVLPDDDTDNIVEIWLPRDAKASIELTAPGSETPLMLEVNPDAQDGDGYDGQLIEIDKLPVGLLLYVNAPPQSDTSSVVLVALAGNRGLRQSDELRQFLSVASASTRSARQSRMSMPKTWGRLWASLNASPEPQAADKDGRKVDRPAATGFAPHGIWHVEIEAQGDKPVNWHAFVQRGDQAPMRRRSARGVIGRQSYIVDGDWSRANPMFTLNGIATATHERLFVVGALERADGRLADYSGSGPARISLNRTCGPDVVVAADESRRRKGLLVQGVLGGARHRVSGTSMAAATVTRHLWEWLHAGRDLDKFVSSSPSPADEPAPTQRGVESPEYAPDFCRGETRRIVSTRPDGAL